MNKIRIVFFLFSMVSLSLFAETKVSIYSVPFGVVGDVSKSNFRAFEKRLSGIPSMDFTLDDKDTVMSGDGITIILDEKDKKVENYNRLLAALYAYAKNTPGVDINAVRQAIGLLVVKNNLEIE